MKKEEKDISDAKEQSPKPVSKGQKKTTPVKTASISKPSVQPDEDLDFTQETAPAAGKAKTLYRVKFFYEWCKSCGICHAMCPKQIILVDDQGHPYIELEDECIGCRNCEIHCPDFAITVKKRYPERRKSNGVS